MYATVRKYKGAGIAEQVANRRKDVEATIKKAPGFLSYYLIKTNDGMVTITVCETQSGAETSNRLAADFIKQNMPTLTSSPPEISAGEVAVTFTSQTAKTHA